MSDERLSYGEVYLADFYENYPCIYLGVKIGRDVIRNVVALRGKRKIRAFDFTEYDLDGINLVVKNVRARGLKDSERKYLANLLEKKLAKTSE